MKRRGYREIKNRQGIVQDAAMSASAYTALTEPNYEIQREKLIRSGCSANGATMAIELLKRQEKANRAAKYAARKGKSPAELEPQTGEKM
ncbi:MAG: hypothetical protein Q4F79_13245 [Eubacteriales bacterium]|nr:hypothetical protein [Eubacteriales bacterium]